MLLAPKVPSYHLLLHLQVISIPVRVRDRVWKIKNNAVEQLPYFLRHHLPTLGWPLPHNLVENIYIRSINTECDVITRTFAACRNLPCPRLNY